MFFICVSFGAGGFLAAAFLRGLVLRNFARLVWAEQGGDHLTFAVAVEVVYAQASGSQENNGSQQINCDMSE